MDKPPTNVIPLFGAQPSEPPLRSFTVNATTPGAVQGFVQALRRVADGLESGALQYTAGGLTVTNQPLDNYDWSARAVVLQGHLVLEQVKP